MATKRRRRSRPNLLDSPVIIGVGFIAVLSTGVTFRHPQNMLITLLFIVVSISLLVGLLCYLTYRRNQVRLHNLRQLELLEIDQMSGIEFESYIAAILKSQGYRTMTTPVSGDFGVDLIARRGADRIAIQIKRYSNRLNQDAVRQAVAGKDHYGCNKTMVVTSSYFTSAATILAASNRCELVDRTRLATWVSSFQAGL
jgi:restriction system protein